MSIIEWIKDWKNDKLVDELMRVQEYSSLKLHTNRKYPRLKNIDYHADIEPYEGCVGGDHLMVINYEDFGLKEAMYSAKKSGNAALEAALERQQDQIGFLIADVAGHSISESVIMNYLHGGIEMGFAYEQMHNGDITPQLFRILNSFFHRHIRPDYLESKPYTTLLYGEISNSGNFRFLSAGHPQPIVFSKEHNKIEKLSDDRKKSSTPLGMLPSRYRMDMEFFQPPDKEGDDYPINEIVLLGDGDLLILYSDGMIDKASEESTFNEGHLEKALRESKNKSAKEIYKAIRHEMASLGPLTDDTTICVIKKR